MALRRLRRFAREGAADELDLDDTIDATARNAGWLDIKHGAGAAQRGEGAAVPRRRRLDGRPRAALRGAVLGRAHRVQAPRVLLLPQLRLRDASGRTTAAVTPSASPTDGGDAQLRPDYKLIFVGDATMSPYEITYPGGSVEHWNEEAGAVWLRRLLSAFPKSTWLNPEPRERWDYTPSIAITRELLEGRMFPLTLAGLDDAIDALS